MHWLHNGIVALLSSHRDRCSATHLSKQDTFSSHFRKLNKQLCCSKEAAQWFVSVSSQLQQYKTSSRFFYCQLRRLQICHCVQLNAQFCCLWRNVEASCHKYFVIFSRSQHRRILPAMCHNLQYGGHSPPATVLTTPACCSINSIAVKKTDIGSESRFLPTPLAFDAPFIGVPVGLLLCRLAWKKLEWCGYPTVKNFWYVYSF